MSEFVLRAGAAADAVAVLALNNASVPHVNALDGDTLAQIVAMSGHYTVAEDAEGRHQLGERESRATTRWG